jgi:leader peptidase (prepilin peptidase)/N-methyltransferase
MASAWILAGVGVVTGSVAGGGGRVLLRSLRRGVCPPAWCCEVAVAVLWAAVTLRMSGGLAWWWAPVPLILGWGGVLLSVCDVVAARLPDALTLPAYPVVAMVLMWVGYWSRAPDLALRGAAGAAVFAGTYMVVRLACPDALGAGDVKLAGSLGAVLGAVSFPAVLLSMTVSALLTVAVSVWCRARAVPHGPAMLLPAWLLVLMTDSVPAVGR